MLEEENVEYESRKEIIKDMNEIRNKIYHNGFNLEEIKNQIGKDPLEVMIRFKPFLYRILLELIGFIDKFFIFILGKLIVKQETLSPDDLLKLKPIIPLEIEEIRIIEELNLLDKKLRSIENTLLSAQLNLEE